MFECGLHAVFFEHKSFKRVEALTLYSQCIFPPPTVHKQAPGCLIGQAVHRWRCSLSSPVVTDGARPWFPRWSAPLAHLGRRDSDTGETHKQTPTRRRKHTHALTHINMKTRLDKQSVKVYTDTHTYKNQHILNEPAWRQGCLHALLKTRTRWSWHSAPSGHPTFYNAGLGQIARRCFQSTTKYKKAWSSYWK